MNELLLQGSHQNSKHVCFEKEMLEWKIRSGQNVISEINQIALKNALMALTMIGKGFEVITNISANLEKKELNVCHKTWISFTYLETPVDHFDFHSIDDNCLFKDVERWKTYFVDIIINKTKSDKNSAIAHLDETQERFNKQNDLTTAILAAVCKK